MRPPPSCRFKRLYRRHQGQRYDRDGRTGEVRKLPQWEATDLLECPTCGRVIRSPPKPGGGSSKICAHQPDWPDFRASLYGHELVPPQEARP